MSRQYSPLAVKVSEQLQPLSMNGHNAELATVSFVVGAAGLTGGALLWFTASPAKPDERATTVGLGLGRLLVTGRF